MSDPRTNSEFQDVLSSIRRLISEDRSIEPKPAGKLVLTAEHRIETPQPDAAEAPWTTREAAGQAVAAWQADVRAEVLTLAVGARTVDEASATLEDTIAELEAAVARIGEDFEPDGGEEALSRGRTDPALEGAFGSGFAVDEAAEAEESGLDLPITGDAGRAPPAATGEADRAADRSGEQSAAAQAGAVEQSAAAQAGAVEQSAAAATPAAAGGLQDAAWAEAQGGEAAAGDIGAAVAGWLGGDPAEADQADDAARGHAQTESSWTVDAETAETAEGGVGGAIDAGSADAGSDRTGYGSGDSDGANPDHPAPDHPAAQADDAQAAARHPANDADPAVVSAATSRIRRLNLAPSGEDDEPQDDAATPEPWARDATQPLLAFAHAAHGGASAATEDDEPGLFDAGDETVIDMETLRELVADIIRQELQGPLGERVTRNVRKLVRREINRALDSRIADAGDEG